MELKENQKVYIRGGKNNEEGKRVIEELERRGGANSDGLTGAYTHFLYYIKQNGEIDYMQDPDGKVAEFMKGYFTEVKVNVNVDDWPHAGDIYYFVSDDLGVWHGIVTDDVYCYTYAQQKARKYYGNFFQTFEQAKEMAAKVRKIFAQ